MLCKHVEPLLNALADGEVSTLTAWRMRLHLCRCSTCAQEYDGIQQVGILARTWREATAVPPPDTLYTDVLARTPTVKAAASNTAKEQKKMIRFVPAVLSAVLFVGGALLAKRYMPHQQAGVAFAEVQRAVAKVQTAHVVLYLEAESNIDSYIAWHKEKETVVLLRSAKKKKEPIKTFIAHESWLRADPPATVWISPVIKTRFIGDATGTTEYQQGKPPKHVSSKPVVRAAVVRYMLFPRQGMLSPQTISGDSRKKWENAVLEKDADGKELLRFTIVDAPNRAYRTLWADPKTRLPVRVVVELWTPADPGKKRPGRIDRMRLEYSYNVTPPAGIFDPPK